MKELTQNGAVSQLQRGLLAPAHGGTEKVEEDWEVSGGGQELTFPGHVTKPRPGLYNTAHLFTSARSTRVCANVHSGTARTPSPLSLASEPRRLGLNKLD